jgi:hypothetical protein
MEPNNLASLRQAAKQHVTKGAAALGHTVNPRLAAGSTQLNEGKSMAATVKQRVTSGTAGVLGQDAISTKAEAGVGHIEAKVAARKQQLIDHADERGKVATHKVDANNSAGHAAFTDIQDKVIARRGHIQGALNSNDPMDLAAPRGLRGPWGLAGGGILAIGEAGAAGAVTSGAAWGAAKAGYNKLFSPATNAEGIPTVPGEAESAVSDIESGAEAVVGDAAEVGLP